MENQAVNQHPAPPAARNDDDDDDDHGDEDGLNSSCCSDFCGFVTYPFHQSDHQHHPSDEDLQGGSSGSPPKKKKTKTTKKDDAVVSSLSPPRSRADTAPLTPEKQRAVSEVQQQQGGSTANTALTFEEKGSPSSSSSGNNNDSDSNKKKKNVTFRAQPSSSSRSTNTSNVVAAVAPEEEPSPPSSSNVLVSRSLLDDLEHLDERVAEREQMVEAEAHRVVAEERMLEQDAAAAAAASFVAGGVAIDHGDCSAKENEKAFEISVEEEFSRAWDGADDRGAPPAAAAGSSLERKTGNDGTPSDEEGKTSGVENAMPGEAKTTSEDEAKNLSVEKEPIRNSSGSNPASDFHIPCDNTDEKPAPSNANEAHVNFKATVDDDDDDAEKQRSVADGACISKPNSEEVQVLSETEEKVKFSTTEEALVGSNVPAGDGVEKQALEGVPACNISSSKASSDEQGPSDKEEKFLLEFSTKSPAGYNTEKRTAEDEPACFSSISRSIPNLAAKGEINSVANFDSHDKSFVKEELAANAPTKEDELPSNVEQNRSSEEMELLSRQSSGSEPYLSPAEHMDDAFERILGLDPVEPEQVCDIIEKEEGSSIDTSMKHDEKLILDLVDKGIDSKMQAIYKSRSREETEEGQSAIRSPQQSTVETELGAAFVAGNVVRSPVTKQPHGERAIDDKNHIFDKTDEAIDTKIQYTKSLEPEEKELVNEEPLENDDNAPEEPIEYDEILPAAAHPAGDSNLAINTVDQSVGNEQLKEAFGEVPVKEGSASSSEAIAYLRNVNDSLDDVPKSFGSEENEKVSMSAEEVVHLGNVNDTIDAVAVANTIVGLVPSEIEDDCDAIFEPKGMNESFLQQENIDEVPFEGEQNTLIEEPAVSPDKDPFVVSEDPIAIISVEEDTMLDEPSQYLQNLSSVPEESINRSYLDRSREDEEAALPSLPSDWETANPQDSPVEISTETEEGKRITNLVAEERAGRRKIDCDTFENQEAASILEVGPLNHAAYSSHQADGVSVDDNASLVASLSSESDTAIQQTKAVAFRTESSGEKFPCSFVRKEQNESSTIEDLTETNDTESRLDENPSLHAKQAPLSTGVSDLKSIFAGDFDPDHVDSNDETSEDKSAIEMQDEALGDSIAHLGDINEAMDVTHVDDESSEEESCLPVFQKVASLVKIFSESSEARPAVGVTAPRSLTPIPVVGSKPDRDDSAGSDPLSFHETITPLPHDEDETSHSFDDQPRQDNAEITSISMLYDDECKKQKAEQLMPSSTHVHYKASPFAFEDDNADDADVHSVPHIPQIEKFTSDLRQEATEIICVNRSMDSADVLSVRSELEAYFPGIMTEWEVQQALSLAKENFQPVLAELEQHFLKKRKPVNNWILMGTVTLLLGLLKLTSLMHEKSMEDGCTNPDFLELRLRIIDYEV